MARCKQTPRLAASPPVVSPVSQPMSGVSSNDTSPAPSPVPDSSENCSSSSAASSSSSATVSSLSSSSSSSSSSTSRKRAASSKPVPPQRRLVDPDDEEHEEAEEEEDEGKKQSSSKAAPRKAKYWDPNRPLTIASTGWVAGERVHARNKAFEHSEMVLRSGFVPPSTEEHDYYIQVGREQLFWQKLADALRPRGITDPDAAKSWFEKHAVREKVDKHPYEFITQAPDGDSELLLEVTTLSGPKSADSSVISDVNRDQLIGQSLTPRAALELFEWTGVPLANWHRRRLIFMLTYWYLTQAPTPETRPDILALNLSLVGRTIIFPRSESLNEPAKGAAVYVREGNNEMFIVPPVPGVQSPVCFSTLDERAVLYEKLGGGLVFQRKITPETYSRLVQEDYRSMARFLERPLRCTSMLSFYKSLLQKIVRLAPINIALDEVDMPIVAAKSVLVATCVAMLPQSTFNPNGGGRETGLQALFKRAMIICYEDGWPKDGVYPHREYTVPHPSTLIKAEELLAWATAMTVLMKNRDVVPTQQILQPIVNALLAAYDSNVAWSFSPVCGAALPESTMPIGPAGETSWHVTGWQARMLTAHLFRTMVFGMSGDVLMLRHEVDAPGDRELLANRSIKVADYRRYAEVQRAIFVNTHHVVARMHLYHAYDHHATPMMAFMFPPGGQGHYLVREGDGGKPYAKLFKAVFTLVTGRNPRRKQHNAIHTTDELADSNTSASSAAFIKECVQVQREFHDYQFRVEPAASTTTTTGCVELFQDYPDAWLAYVVSSREFKWKTSGGTNVLWTWALSTADVTDVVVARSHGVRSSLRNGNQDVPDQASDWGDQALRDLEERNIAEVRAEVYRQLGEGIKVPSSRFLLHTGLASTLVVRYHQADANNSAYMSVDGRPWEEFRRDIPIRLPSVDFWHMPTNLNNPPITCGVPPDVARFVPTILEKARSIGISESGIRMAIARLSSLQADIEFTVPGRDGGPARDRDLAPSTVQFDACQMLKLLAGISTSIIERTEMPQRFITRGAALFFRRQLAQQLDRATITLPEIGVQQLVEKATTSLKTISDDFSTLSTNPNSYFGEKRNHTQPVGLQDHQRSVLDELAIRVARQRLLHHFVRLSVGAGKTVIALLYYRLLLTLLNNNSAVFCLFVTTDSALQQVATDAQKLGLFTVVLEKIDEVEYFARNMPDELEEPSVAFVTHTTLKNMSSMCAIQNLISRAVLIMDEVHKTMGNGTQIGERMFQLAEQALSTLAMTATPLRNTREEMALRRWVQLGVPFPCMDTAAFHVALSSIVTAPVRLRIPTVMINYDLLNRDDWHRVYGSFDDYNTTRHNVLQQLPDRWGGLAENMPNDVSTLRTALAISYETTDAAMVKFVVRLVQSKKRPFVIARDNAHCAALAARIRELLLPGAVVWDYNPERGTPKLGTTQFADDSGPCVAVMPLRYNTGYEATHFNVVVSAVYPSNQADREQIVGRVARFGQLTSPIEVHTMSAGLTTLMLRNHIYAANLNKMIAELNRA